MSLFHGDSSRDRFNSDAIMQQLKDELGRDRDMFFQPNDWPHNYHRPSAHEMFNSSPKPFTRMGWPDDPSRRPRRMRDRHSSGSSGFSEEEDSGRASCDCSSQGSAGAEGVERTIPIQIIREDTGAPVNHTPGTTSRTPVNRKESHEGTRLPGPQHSVSSSEVESRLPKTEDEQRQNRASSAPPDDCTSPRKFSSKVKITSDEEDNSTPHCDRHQRPSVVRRIPIVIEGQDHVDSYNKNQQYDPRPQASPRPSAKQDHGSSYRHNQTHSEFPRHSPRETHHYASSPRDVHLPGSPRESYFPGSPRESHFPGSPREAHFASSPRESHFSSSPRETHHFPATKKLSSEYAPGPKPEEHHNATSTEQEMSKQEKPKELSPMEKLEAIEEEVKELRKSVETFSNTKDSKDFLYLDEMLTRSLLKLDVIDTGGKDEIRQKRKAIVKLINGGIEDLEKRITKSDSQKESDPTQTHQSTISQTTPDQESQQSNPETTPKAQQTGDKPSTQSETETASNTTTECQTLTETPVAPAEKRMRSEITINLGDPKN